jgi:hypothetical protein
VIYLGNPNLASDCKVDMQRKQDEKRSEKENRHESFFLLMNVQAHESNRSREKQAAQNVEGNQDFSLTIRKASRLELHDSCDPDHQEHDGKYEKSTRKHHLGSYHGVTGAAA